MAKMTLLEIVQDILNDLDSDSVNSINDTIEAQQVAQIVKTSFYAMLGNRNWPHTRRIAQMEGVGDVTRPNFLRIPSNWKELQTFKYQKQKLGATDILIREVSYKTPDDFLRFISHRNSSTDNVQTVTDVSGVKLLIVDDTAPTYWTSFDDVYIVTDSYDRAVDTTLQQQKTECVVYVEPLWSMTDSAVPDLPTEAFIALLEESKSAAFLNIKQSANQKAEQRATKQQRWLSRKAWTAAGGVQYPDYGRRSPR
jgi:hypothetical protein